MAGKPDTILSAGLGGCVHSEGAEETCEQSFPLGQDGPATAALGETSVQNVVRQVSGGRHHKGDACSN